MIDKVDIPRNLVGSFKRVARRIPADLKKDQELIETVVAYLQLGGEKLARQAVASAKHTLELEVAQRKKRAREEALIRAAEARLAAANEESKADDDEFDDDDNVFDDDNGDGDGDGDGEGDGEGEGEGEGEGDVK